MTTGGLTILLLAANPVDTPLLRLEEEIRAIDRRLRGAAYRDQIDFRPHLAMRVADLQELLLRYQPGIVHFSGHGTEAGEILLQDDSGRAQPVAASALVDLFGLFRTHVRCIVLNACYSDIQAQAIARHIDMVVGMGNAVSDRSSLVFAGSFYQAVGYGRDLRAAFDLACNQLALENDGDANAPRFLARPGTNPETLALLPLKAADRTLQASTIVLEHVQARDIHLGPSITYVLPERPETPLAEALARLEQLPLDTLPQPASLPARSLMPFSRNPLFVGRQEEMLALARMLKSESVSAGSRTAALTGLGGIGKTQMAVEFVHRYGQFFAGGVWWLSFAEADAVAGEFVRCGGPGGLDLPGFRGLSFDDQIERIRSAFQEATPRLLIFNNCEDEELLAQWRPASGGAHILITSRRGAWSPVLAVHTVALSPLPRRDSVVLLSSFPPYSQAVDPALDAIAAALGDLPLALHLAGSYLSRYRAAMSPARYLDQLRQGDPLLHRSLASGDRSPTAHEQHVARTFYASYRSLDRAVDVDALANQVLLHVAQFLPGVPVALALLVATLPTGGEDSHLAVIDAVGRLYDLGLVTVEEAGAVAMHPLVAAFVHQLPDSRTACAAAEIAVLHEADRINTARAPWELNAWDVHLRHFADRSLADGTPLAADLCWELGSHLHTIGNFNGALPYLEQALQLRQERFGAAAPETAECMDSLGLLLKDLGDLERARTLLEQALALRRQALGEDHADTAQSYNDLGELLRASGDLPAAQGLFKQALAIVHSTLGIDHPHTLVVLNNLGMACLSAGDLSGAHGYLQQTLDTRRRVLGEMHPDTAASYNNLGSLLNAMGDLQGALSNCQQAMDIWRATLGEEHPNTALAFHNVGRTLQAMQVLTGAEYYLEHSLDLYRRIYGEKHPETALTFNNVGLLRQALGNAAGARACFQAALRVLSQLLPPDHSLLVAINESLATVQEAKLLDNSTLPE